MKIAFFTLLSPLKSALADYGEGLAAGLSRIPGVSVDLFINDDYWPDNPVIVEQFNIYPYTEFESRTENYDVIFYSMGDHYGYNGYMLDFIYRYPGVTLLHDLTLHRCIMHATLGQGKPQAYLKELQYAGAPASFRLSRQIEAHHGNQLILEYPLFQRVVDSSLGVIVHNEYARRRILDSRPQANVRRIPHAFFMPPGFSEYDIAAERAQQRRALQLEPQDFVVGSFGIFVPDKHLESSLAAFAAVAQRYPNAKYLLGGAPANGYDLAGQIRRMGLADKVTITGWLPPPEFARQMFALDVGIHLRYPHIGGTPYTPIRLMGLNVATIISDIEPLAEIPLGACVKIPPDDYAPASLTAVLERLADDQDFRQLIGENGRQYIARHHSIDQIAPQYAAFLASCA
ncbi:MAG TPA: glycosyltransferase [Anaerolineae bacterium]|nr:glycosyltransferase [Anaerolineae bacterium]